MIALRLVKILGARKAMRQMLVSLLPRPIFDHFKLLFRTKSPTINLSDGARSPNAQALFECLAEEGAILSFGSLLGLVREGEFLPHDNDIDFIYTGDLSKLQERLSEKSNGQWITRARGISTLKISIAETCLTVDIFRAFPCVHGGYLSTVACGQETAVYFFPTEQILPAQRRTFASGSFLIPAAPESFLQLHYGDTWGAYDPHWTYANAPSRVPLGELNNLDLSGVESTHSKRPPITCRHRSLRTPRT